MADTNEAQQQPESKLVRIVGFVALILFVAAIFVGFLSLRNDVAQLKVRLDAVEAKLADGE